MKKMNVLLLLIVSILSSCNTEQINTEEGLTTLEYSYGSWGYCLEYIELNFVTMQGRVLAANFGEISGSCSNQASDKYVMYNLNSLPDIENLKTFIEKNKTEIIVKPKKGEEPTDMPYWHFKIENSDNSKIEYSQTTFYSKDKIDEIVAKIYETLQ